MAFEHRGKRRYAYRSVRVDGRVRKQYLGRGPAAEAELAVDAAARADRAADAVKARAMAAELEALDDAGAALDAGACALVEALLGGLGYAKRRGEWRKRHDDGHGCQTNKTPAGHGRPAGPLSGGGGDRAGDANAVSPSGGGYGAGPGQPAGVGRGT